MLLRVVIPVLVVALMGGAAWAQNKVRTETIKPPPAAQPSGDAPAKTSDKSKPDGHVVAPASPRSAAPEIITDPARLPATVAQTRERILAAARSGDLQKLLGVMQAGGALPIFSFSEDKNPIAFWKASYPDSDGVEILSILVTILETGFVHVDVGTPQEIYLWPYHARLPLKSLTPEQKVELFRIVTGADYKDMVEFGAYSFYRLGIAPDGTWHFFVAGD